MEVIKEGIVSSILNVTSRSSCERSINSNTIQIRTAFIALLNYQDGEKRICIAQNGLQVGQNVVSGEQVAPEIGNAMPLSEIPLGTIISCIELRPGQGAVMARSAGAFAQLMARDGKFATVKLPSGETRLILVLVWQHWSSFKFDHQLLVSGKAVEQDG